MKENQIERIHSDNSKHQGARRKLTLRNIVSEGSKRKQSDQRRLNLRNNASEASRAEKKQEDYEAKVLEEQKAYLQIQARSKKECTALENQRLRYGIEILPKVVGAHRLYFHNEKIAVLQTQIMAMNDELDFKSDYEQYLQRTIQKKRSEGRSYQNPRKFVAKQHFACLLMFYSVKDAMDSTAKLRPDQDLQIPLILTVLCEQVKQLNGFQTEHIFR